MRWFELLLLLALLAFGICAYQAGQSVPPGSHGAEAVHGYIRRVAAMLLVGIAAYLFTMRHTRDWIKRAGTLLLAGYASAQALVLWLRTTQPEVMAAAAAATLQDVEFTPAATLDVALGFVSAGLIFAFVIVLAMAIRLRLA